MAYYRGYVTQEQENVGGMAAISLGSDDVLKFLEDGVVIACENSPSSTTISGDLSQLEKVLERVKVDRPDVTARKLKVNMAYHSRGFSIAKTVIQANVKPLKIICTPLRRCT